MFRSEYESLNVEHLIQIKINNAELRQREAKEQAVQSRYRRMTAVGIQIH